MTSVTDRKQKFWQSPNFSRLTSAVLYGEGALQPETVLHLFGSGELTATFPSHPIEK